MADDVIDLDELRAHTKGRGRDPACTLTRRALRVIVKELAQHRAKQGAPA